MAGTLKLPGGVWPTMITPFKENGSIDYACLDSFIEWYISSGCTGLFTVCLSSEMYQLSNEERLQLARHVKERSRQRVPVVAGGTFGGSIEEMAEFVKKMSQCVDAVVVLTNQLVGKDEDDIVLLQNLEKLTKLTPGVPLGLYECPVPYPRYLSPKIMHWAASNRRFFFHKDTECKKDALVAKIQAVKSIASTPFQFFNADIATLKFSLEKGASGFSGISANLYPWMLTWLCKHFDDEKEKADAVQNFFGTGECLVSWKYPASAKLYHQLNGMDIDLHCRIEQWSFNDAERTSLNQLRSMMKRMCEKVGIFPVELSHPVR